MSDWNSFVIMTVDKCLEKQKKRGIKKYFSSGYPPAEKCDGTLSQKSSHHDIGSVDKYLYARK